MYLNSSTSSEINLSVSSRMEKRRVQRLFAMELDPTLIKVKSVIPPSPMLVVRKLKLSVLEPSVFILVSFNDAD
jgi:hypothetical protein